MIHLFFFMDLLRRYRHLQCRPYSFDGAVSVLSDRSVPPMLPACADSLQDARDR
jgi:hypothetical protein